MNIAEWLFRAARRQPEAPALIRSTALQANYRGFAERAAGLAAGLQAQRGTRPGDRVGLYMANSCEYLIALQGILWAGAVAVPINSKLHPREAAWIIDNAECHHVLVADPGALAGHIPDAALLCAGGPEFAALMATAPGGAPCPRGADDLAWLFYTSGTTGRPKGVMVSHGNLMALALCYFADVDAIDPGEAMLYAAPLSHAAGFYSLPAMRAGAAHIVPESGGFDPEVVLALAAAHGRVSMFAAPTMVRRLVEAAGTRGVRGNGLKTIVYGGGPMYLADILEAMETLDCGFAQIYAQGESPMCITAMGAARHADRTQPHYRERLASVGAAQSAVEVRVTGPDGQPVPAGAVGEIEVKGPSVMLGYWRNPEATAAAISGGWLRTGDVGALDEDGFLSLRDRSKDMIISGGTNIYPREVEEVLLTHPDVREAAVIGRRHEEWGEEVIACVVPEDGRRLDMQALDTLCLDTIARFKRPRAYFLMDSLPRNNYGKVLKTELRRQFGMQREGTAS